MDRWLRGRVRFGWCAFAAAMMVGLIQAGATTHTVADGMDDGAPLILTGILNLGVAQHSCIGGATTTFGPRSGPVTIEVRWGMVSLQPGFPVYGFGSNALVKGRFPRVISGPALDFVRLQEEGAYKPDDPLPDIQMYLARSTTAGGLMVESPTGGPGFTFTYLFGNQTCTVTASGSVTGLSAVFPWPANGEDEARPLFLPGISANGDPACPPDASEDQVRSAFNANLRGQWNPEFAAGIVGNPCPFPVEAIIGIEGHNGAQAVFQAFAPVIGGAIPGYQSGIWNIAWPPGAQSAQDVDTSVAFVRRAPALQRLLDHRIMSWSRMEADGGGFKYRIDGVVTNNTQSPVANPRVALMFYGELYSCTTAPVIVPVNHGAAALPGESYRWSVSLAGPCEGSPFVTPYGDATGAASYGISGVDIAPEYALKYVSPLLQFWGSICNGSDGAAQNIGGDLVFGPSQAALNVTLRQYVARGDCRPVIFPSLTGAPQNQETADLSNVNWDVPTMKPAIARLRATPASFYRSDATARTWVTWTAFNASWDDLPPGDYSSTVFYWDGATPTGYGQVPFSGLEAGKWRTFAIDNADIVRRVQEASPDTFVEFSEMR